MGAISSHILSRKKILSNATTERLPPKIQRKSEKRAEKARKKGKPHLEITSDGYIHLVKAGTNTKTPPPSPTKGKGRGASPDEASSGATTSSRPKNPKPAVPPTDPSTEEDSFYDEAFGLYPAELAPNKPPDAIVSSSGDGAAASGAGGGRADASPASAPFAVLSLEQIRQKQQELIKRVADLLSVSTDKATLMLLCFRWQLEDLVDAYRIDPERVCKESGVRIESCALIQDPQDEAERERLKRTFKRWPRSAPPVVAPARRHSDMDANADASSTNSVRRATVGIDRPPTPRRPSGNRIQLHFPPITRLAQQPADATAVEVLTDEMLAPYGLDMNTFNQRLASLQDIIAVADTQRAVQLLLGAGCDVNIATNHYFNQLLDEEEDGNGGGGGGGGGGGEDQRQRISTTSSTAATIPECSIEALISKYQVLDAEIEQMIAELEMRNEATTDVETRKQVLQIARHSIRRQDNGTFQRVLETPPAQATQSSDAPNSPGDPQLRRIQRRGLLLRLLSGEQVQAANLLDEESASVASSDTARVPPAEPSKEVAAVAAPPEAAAASVPLVDEMEPVEPILLEPIESHRHGSQPPVLSSSRVPSLALAEPSASEKADHPGETLCPVCYCWTKDDECFRLECDHAYCIDCWRGHLTAKLSDGPNCLFARCMAPKCSMTVTVELWQRLLAPASFERYEAFLIKSFVTGNSSNCCWCPNPRSCDLAIVATTEADGIGEAIVHCRCGFAFCWGCKEERHVPITCEQLNAWLQQCSREKASGLSEWIIANAKPCPGCKSPIEKNDGCMHMSCIVCNHEFCWLCRAPWSTHGEQTGGYFACNRYATSDAKKEDDNNENRKAQLRRFLHYYERYAQHHRSKEIAAKLLDEAPARLREYLNRNPKTPLSNFFLEAAKLVQDCRSVLKNTYAFAYFLPLRETPEKRLFEYLQANLEATTEKLTELVEQPLEKVQVELMVSYTKATRRFLENLLHGLQSGLTYNQPFVETPPKRGKQRKALGSEDDLQPHQLPSLPEP